MPSRLMRLFGVLLFTLAIGVIAPPMRVLACSCIALAPGQAIGMANLAFTGVVAAVDDPATGPVVSTGDPIQYTFVVESALKGDPGEVIILSSARDGVSCGMTFALGQRWTIYANLGDPAGPSTGICSGNELLAEGVPIPPVSDESGGLPLQLILVGAAVLAVAGLSAVVFLRRPARG